MLVPRAPPRRPLRLPVATIPPPSPCRAVASHAVLLAPRHYASVLSPLQPQPPPPSSSLKQTTFADSFAHRCRRRAYTTSPFINVSDHFAPFTPIASHHGRVMVVNAADLDPELVWQMNLKLIEWDRDKDVNVVIMEKTYPPSGTPSEYVFEKKDVIRCHSLLAHRIATMDTPVVSLLEGVCAKEHLSTILHTPFRIATEKTVCSFDQPILPGTSFFLSRLMGGSPLGKYLALTGRPLTGMENVLSGVATHHLPSDRIPALIEHLCTVKTSDLRILDDAIAAFLDASPSLDEWKSWALGGSVGDTINRCFQHDTFTEIVKALEKENTSASKEALDLLEKRSAADLELALKCLSLGSRVDLATSLIADCEALTQGKVTLSAQKRKPTEEDREKHKALVSEATGDLILSSAKTFDYYSFRTVTCLPSEEDVRLVVSGEAVGVGDLALTTDEVLEYFSENWNDFLSDKALRPLSFVPTGGESASDQEARNEAPGEETEAGTAAVSRQAESAPPFFPSKYFRAEESDPLDPTTRLGRRKETWGMRQRVLSVLDQRCELVNGQFLRWSRKSGGGGGGGEGRLPSAVTAAAAVSAATAGVAAVAAGVTVGDSD